MQHSQNPSGLLLPGVPRSDSEQEKGTYFPAQRQDGRQAAEEGRQAMIYRRGKSGTYWFRFRFGGRFVHESARTQSKTLAREAERQRRRELEEKWNRVERRTLPPRFERAALDWLEAVKPHIASRTQGIYDVAIRCHLSPALGSMLLCDIGAREIAAYQARRKAEGASARTLNKELQVLRQILKRYKLWPALQGEVKFEREPASIGKALMPEEESALLAATERNPVLHTVVTLALNTAMRKNEMRTLRWGQIDLFQRTLTVGRSKTEGSSGRVIPLNSVAHAALVRWAGRFPEAQPEHYVFPACEDARLDCPRPAVSKIDPSRPIRSWRTAWRHALKDAGLGIRFHDLRHTCITKLAEGQASEQTIMAIAGHLSRAMLEHYSHIRMAAKRAALEGIAKVSEVGILGAGVHQNVHQLPTEDSSTVAKSLN
jgi:integrase